MPELLDLFCCEGGAGEGYRRAGFNITGIDHERQTRYPGRFIQWDALEFVKKYGHRYDAVHASPPCQKYSRSKHTHSKEHPDLLQPTRDALEELGKPYIIENVYGADMTNIVTLCGATFGLTATDTDGTPLVLRRHRLFESNEWLWPAECEHLGYVDRGYKIAGVYGAGCRTQESAKERGGGYTPSKEVAERLLGIDWMSAHGLTQAIPPAYTEYLGKQLIEILS